jgi:hypothetical protein
VELWQQRQLGNGVGEMLGTSVEHPEAPPCDLDGLEGVAPLLRFSAAGKALPRYLFDCICLPYSSN